MTLVSNGVQGALVRMGCEELEPMLAFLVELGFRLDAIFPADQPRTAILRGHGMGIELVRGEERGVGLIRLLCDDATLAAHGGQERVAPNGVRIRYSAADPAIQVPPTHQALVLSRAQDDAHWSVGRAGLRYRDLLPERHGGAFIASHIRILEGGPVPDYVHYHKVRFQMIYCRRGWVRVVYQGQGAPFVMQAGDCVLQPPTIRHRVLESSAGAEVVEIGGPAEHITMADHDMALPNTPLPPGHDFHGQRFVRHVAAEAAWHPWRVPGFMARDTGIGAATSGLAGARVVKPEGATSRRSQQHSTEFCFYFVLAGRMAVQLGGEPHALAADDSIAIPGDTVYALEAASPDLEFLEVTLPERFETRH